MIYPADYPQPTWRYSQEMTVYPERSQMECGWSRQRRAWIAQGSAVTLEFVMDTDTFDDWMDWVAANGYQYFTIDLDRVSGVKQPQDIRFVTPIQYAYQNYDTIKATVAGEYQLNLVESP